MQGNKTGVMTSLKELANTPCLVGVHCTAIKLGLVHKSAMKTIPAYTRVDACFQVIYIFIETAHSNDKQTPSVPLPIWIWILTRPQE